MQMPNVLITVSSAKKKTKAKQWEKEQGKRIAALKCVAVCISKLKHSYRLHRKWRNKRLCGSCGRALFLIQKLCWNARKRLCLIRSVCWSVAMIVETSSRHFNTSLHSRASLKNNHAEWCWAWTIALTIFEQLKLENKLMRLCNWARLLFRWIVRGESDAKFMSISSNWLLFVSFVCILQQRWFEKLKKPLLHFNFDVIPNEINLSVFGSSFMLI